MGAPCPYGERRLRGMKGTTYRAPTENAVYQGERGWERCAPTESAVCEGTWAWQCRAPTKSAVCLCKMTVVHEPPLHQYRMFVLWF
jgi:hypothetical protein